MRKRPRRKPLLPLLLLLFLTSSFFVVLLRCSRVYTLITLLFEDGAQDLVDDRELRGYRKETAGQKIPRIIHQTYANESVTGTWEVAQMTCLALHEGWEYMLWTDAKARYFIEKEYSWFLKTYDSYPYMIQRADTIRYFVLAHYGGVYIDLDEGCVLPLDSLLPFPAFLRLTTPTGISNDIMGSAPSHPFFLHVIRSLQAYARNWYVPYITVMYTTGPLFLSVMWKEYMMRGDSRGDGRVRVLGLGEEGAEWVFWMHVQGGGSSWHRADAKVILWMGDHWALLTFLGFLLITSLLISLYRIYTRLFLFKTTTTRVYRKRRTKSLESGLWRLLPQQLGQMDIFSLLPWSSSKNREWLEERIE